MTGRTVRATANDRCLESFGHEPDALEATNVPCQPSAPDSIFESRIASRV
jgi:hypothetical protein